MPLLHCDKCHHEWEGNGESRCAWCGSDGYVLTPTTPLEDMMKAVRAVGGWKAYNEAKIIGNQDRPRPRNKPRIRRRGIE